MVYGPNIWCDVSTNKLKLSEVVLCSTNTIGPICVCRVREKNQNVEHELPGDYYHHLQASSLLEVRQVRIHDDALLRSLRLRRYVITDSLP